MTKKSMLTALPFAEPLRKMGRFSNFFEKNEKKFKKSEKNFSAL